MTIAVARLSPVGPERDLTSLEVTSYPIFVMVKIWSVERFSDRKVIGYNEDQVRSDRTNHASLCKKWNRFGKKSQRNPRQKERQDTNSEIQDESVHQEIHLAFHRLIISDLTHPVTRVFHVKTPRFSRRVWGMNTSCVSSHCAGDIGKGRLGLKHPL